jgi:hypothetical protein
VCRLHSALAGAKDDFRGEFSPMGEIRRFEILEGRIIYIKRLKGFDCI